MKYPMTPDGEIPFWVFLVAMTIIAAFTGGLLLGLTLGENIARTALEQAAMEVLR